MSNSSRPWIVDPQSSAYRDYQRQRQLTLGDLLLENRIIFLQGEIHDGNANELVMKLLYLAERKPPQGHSLLHQFARRQRQRHAGDLRHDADSQLPGGHLLRRPGGQRRRGAAGRRHERQTLRPAARQGDDPPALRPGRRAGFGHRNPGQRNPQNPRRAEPNPFASTPASPSNASPRIPIAISTWTPEAKDYGIVDDILSKQAVEVEDEE